MKAVVRGTLRLLACIAAAATLSCSHLAPQDPRTDASIWNPKAAAAYLDDRAGWWMEWTASARDHGTVCVSCHTGVPYALARPALRGALAEPGPSGNERRLIDDVIRRVRLGKDAGPYYSDEVCGGKAGESRGTEAVLNALILASNSAQKGQFDDATRAAFANLWALQQTAGENRGSWLWLQFNLEPWEGSDSAYYGATLAALAVGTAPGNYRATAEIQPQLGLLRDYLNRESAAQSPLNRVFLLWASDRLPGLLTAARQKTLVDEILSQQQADGGWRLASLAWNWRAASVRSLARMWLRAGQSPMAGTSDGVATGLAAIALQEAGVGADNVQLRRGLAWLRNNQHSTEGYWLGSSLNRRRRLSSGVGLFMSDAATAYAVLALEESERAANSMPPLYSRGSSQ